MSLVTTHILDTTRGRPAAGVAITMYEKAGLEWIEVASGITDHDGRIKELLKPGITLPFGTYKMHFAVKEYFEVHGIDAFYPFVDIVFDIRSKEHYHVPLLLNPFGYSTYRGS
jgi:5-hydroxyisourate hydrolase